MNCKNEKDRRHRATIISKLYEEKLLKITADNCLGFKERDITAHDMLEMGV